MEADTPGLGAEPSQKSASKSPDDQVQDALESILSKKNLVRDQFLASKMNPQMYIPIAVLLVHHRLQALGATHDQVAAAAAKSKRLGVDDQRTMVRPVLKSKRNVVILRDLPEGTTEEEIMQLLASGPYAENVVSVKPEVNNTWFVKFNVDDGAQDVVLWLRSQSFKGKPLNAAIKSEHFLRSFFPVNANLGFVPPGLPPMEQADGMNVPDMLQGFPSAQFGGKGLGYGGPDLPPPGMGHPLGMMMPPEVPLMQPLQYGLQGPGFWKPWGSRFKQPPLVLPANGLEALSLRSAKIGSGGEGVRSRLLLERIDEFQELPQGKFGKGGKAVQALQRFVQLRPQGGQLLSSPLRGLMRHLVTKKAEGGRGSESLAFACSRAGLQVLCRLHEYVSLTWHAQMKNPSYREPVHYRNAKGRNPTGKGPEPAAGLESCAQQGENGDTAEVEKPTDVEAAEVVEDLDAVKEDPKPKRQRRNRWGQEPEAPPMPSADDLALAPLMSMDTAALGLLPVQPGMGATPGAGASLDLSAAAQAAREALEKAKRAAMFQRQIQEQMAKIKGQGLGGGFMGAEAPKARKLILDEFGRELDEDGQVVPMKPQVVSTLKVNINREKEARLKKILGLKKDAAGGESSYFDSTLKVKERFERQKRRNFRFIEEGELVKKEQKMIKKVQEKALGIDKKDDKKKKEEEQKKQEKKQEEEEKEQPVKKIEPKVMRREPIPDVEWWDAPFLKEDQYGQRRTYTEVNVERITPYVEHPIPIKITTEKEAPEAAMMHLTPKERKKLRRLKRQERTQEIRDKIKMGILQAPPPKVKMANLMRVLGDEAIADPSTVERKVRQDLRGHPSNRNLRQEHMKSP
ncbi:RDM16 [Symbiodinium sp. CCMP2456]|nr:RDM16 [Symbiodinium sp. CCMP2456]